MCFHGRPRQFFERTCFLLVPMVLTAAVAIGDDRVQPDVRRVVVTRPAGLRQSHAGDARNVPAHTLPDGTGKLAARRRLFAAGSLR